MDSIFHGWVSLLLYFRGWKRNPEPAWCVVGRFRAVCTGLFFSLSGFGQGFKILQGGINLRLGKIMVGQLASEEIFIGAQIHKAMAAPVEEDDFFLSLFLG